MSTVDAVAAPLVRNWRIKLLLSEGRLGFKRTSDGRKLSL
jgi:hypothetical protein